MSLVRGFVQLIEARDDGWVQVRIISPHAGNSAQTLFIQSLDGDLAKAHRRLAQLGLLRDALAQTLPLEVSYSASDVQGDVINDVTILRTRSIEGRQGGTWVAGTVLSVSVVERGPLSAASPYRDEADVALIALMSDDGSVAGYQLDLQRVHEGTGHALLAMVELARRSRRVIVLQLATTRRSDKVESTFIVAARWQLHEQSELTREVAFVERVAQRVDSYDSNEPRRVGYAEVTYTTAPEQFPEGDLSENGSFVPRTTHGWVAQDSPLLTRLLSALREGLQVALLFREDVIHAVELISPLGSATKPVWIRFGSQAVGRDEVGVCVNVPTITSPDATHLNAAPHSVKWSGEAYFNEGIWRVLIASDAEVKAEVDGKSIECSVSVEGPREERLTLAHLYLNGVHRFDFLVCGHRCDGRFQTRFYRIR